MDPRPPLQLIALRATLGAPRLQPSHIKLPPDTTWQSLHEHVLALLSAVRAATPTLPPPILHLYVATSIPFTPLAEQRLGDLAELFFTGEELLVAYSMQSCCG